MEVEEREEADRRSLGKKLWDYKGGGRRRDGSRVKGEEARNLSGRADGSVKNRGEGDRGKKQGSQKERGGF